MKIINFFYIWMYHFIMNQMHILLFPVVVLLDVIRGTVGNNDKPMTASIYGAGDATFLYLTWILFCVVLIGAQ